MVEHNGITLKDVSFSIGKFSLQDFSLNIERGDYFVLTGPNGSGKTMIVKLIAGLLQPLSGSIFINDREITNLPPWQRGIGYVPQDGVLFPNRTVFENISFGLEVRRLDKGTREREVKRIAGVLNIEHLLNRSIRGLSGGEQQKVGLARALVYSPTVLLMDEPVSAIDEETRNRLCVDLRRVHDEMGITTLHISHNTGETELVADKVAILRDGRIESTNDKSV